MSSAGSLRARLLGNLALLLVVLMIASGLSAYWNGREAADTAYDRTLLASARTIAAGLFQRDGTLSADVPYVALDTFDYDSVGRIYYQVNDTQRRLVSGYENIPGPPPGTPRTDDYPALARFYDASYRGQDVRVVSLLKAMSDPNMSGMAEIRVAETTEARVRMARSLMADTLLRLGMLALGALLLVWFAVSAALRPLERLRSEVEERQPDDLRPLPTVEVQHELGPLVRALNHFTERLRRQFERQGQFIADAAHEMRTPLAVLRLHAQNALEAGNDAERQKALGFLMGGVDRLTRVVNQLLTLARVEPRLGQRASTQVDLAEVVTDTLADLTPWILDRGLEPSLDIGEGNHHLAIDAGALGIALQNLVSNAVEHSPPAGRITVSLRRQGNHFELVVEDEGPGIDEASLSRVFERFYSRNSPNGAGLGLSIVATIVERLGGQVRLDNRASGGLAATLLLPAG